jgi:hypothetical protein
MKRNILVGKTKIVLTDIRTGEVKTYEDKNTFQNTVVADYMRPLGAYNNSPYANSTWAGQEMWRNLAGGLLLFRDAIDLTNGPVKYMPAGNEMVGNGAYGVVNNSTPVELGSYNSTESTSGPDSVSMVYDFTSAQANGTIGCICLTTETGGYIGYGNKSGAAHSTVKALSLNQSSRSLGRIAYNNALYSFAVSSGKVTVTKTPTEVTQGSIFDGMAEASYDITFTGTTPAYYTAPMYIGDGKVALLDIANQTTGRTLANGSNYTFLIVNLANDTAESVTFTNASGYALSLGLGLYGNVFYGVLAIDDSHIFFATGSTGDAPIIGINYRTGATDYVITEAGGRLWDTNTYNTFFGGKLTDDLTMVRINNGYGFIVDKVNETAYPFNCNPLANDYNDNLDALTSYSGMVKNPLMLTTVNNLDSPVTKTANQTMKVTYTLTKVVV